ncbi:MAG: NAD(P)-binding protein [Deltaproteobacteria bacterium]|nr:NAD(P)-binding protein [Deltaproteobacteria bacterium]
MGTGPDVVVVGSGFGGLGCALTLAERGLRPRVYEALKYPGGCASTFTRDGFAFESGATLFSGLAEHQLFGQWMKRHRMDVQVSWLDPLVELRAPGLHLPVTRDRDAFVARLAGEAGPLGPNVRRFFALQRRVADALWAVLDSPELLPPFSARALWAHAARLPQYLPLAGLVGRPLLEVLDDHGLGTFTPLRTWANALCQITVQCGVAEAEAPFALATLDYAWRGTGHVVGGIGRLADGMVRAIRAAGGEVCFGERVKGLERSPEGWRVTTTRGGATAPTVVANTLPADLDALVGRSTPALASLQDAVRTGWGAAMLYAVADAHPGAPASAHHLELVADATAPLHEGNHLFVSISAADEHHRAPPGQRTLTASTHVFPQALEGQTAQRQAAYVSRVQATMKATLGELAPEWAGRIRHLLPGSPRTFQRFTRRTGGYVGGIPRRAGLHHYAQLTPVQPAERLWLVGDSVFPGQSILAAALGGVRVAEAVERSLRN